MISESHMELIEGYRDLIKDNIDISNDLLILNIIEGSIKLLTSEYVKEHSIDSNVFNIYDEQYMRVLETHQSELLEKGMGAIIR